VVGRPEEQSWDSETLGGATSPATNLPSGLEKVPKY
jgi:hypothetical protein